MSQLIIIKAIDDYELYPNTTDEKEQITVIIPDDTPDITYIYDEENNDWDVIGSKKIYIDVKKIPLIVKQTLEKYL